MAKAIFFIDGFNLYHSLAIPQFPSKYKWLDLDKLCKLLMNRNDTFVEINYFTAICSWDQNKANKHKTYITALENKGIKVTKGNFKNVTRKCRGKCQEIYWAHEEKETDVNIAVKLLSFAVQGKYDNAYLLSGDGDLIPAVKEVKNLYPAKKIILLLPRGNKSVELTKQCHQKIKIKERHLKTSLFDTEIIKKDGSKIVCPTDWQ